METTKKTTDYSFILDTDLSESITIKVLLLSDISICNDIPGDYLKTIATPPKKMFVGMIENYIGLHICNETRISLLKKAKIKQEEPVNNDNDNTYIPILKHLIQIETVVVPEFTKYTDLYCHAMSKKSSMSHINGSKNLPKLAKEKIDSGSDLTDKDVHLMPHYYTTIRKREYMTPKYKDFGFYIFNIKTNKAISELMKSNANKSASIFLGNSDSWVHISVS